MTAPIDRAPIDALVAGFAADRHCPSIGWGVIQDGRLVGHGSTGVVGARPPDERTVYRIASMTKSFSAAATLLLRDEGALGLEDPIGRHAPELAHLRSPTSDAPAITIRDLLTMGSGLAGDDPWADRHLDLTDDHGQADDRLHRIGEHAEGDGLHGAEVGQRTSVGQCGDGKDQGRFEFGP
ncbi:MAG: serine hydrolase domain-containing protein, partial [Acidimicrobiia bacterium]